MIWVYILIGILLLFAVYLFFDNKARWGYKESVLFNLNIPVVDKNQEHFVTNVNCVVTPKFSPHRFEGIQYLWRKTRYRKTIEDYLRFYTQVAFAEKEFGEISTNKIPLIKYIQKEVNKVILPEYKIETLSYQLC